LEIGRIEHENLSFSHFASRLERIGDTPARPVCHNAKESVLLLESVQQFGSLIRAAIVYDNEFASVIEWCESGRALTNEFGQVFCLIFRWYEDAHLDGVAVAGKRHTRFRIRAGRMCN
jgi:hypothetical protein